MNKVELVSEVEVTVRFSDTDSMGVVWHGEYLKYFEDGRESFGEKYGLGYWYIYKNEVFAPVVKLNCEFKKSISFSDKILVRTRYIHCETAKIIFEYEIIEQKTKQLVATGRTEQVFTDTNHNLILYSPEFYQVWKNKWNLI